MIEYQDLWLSIKKYFVISWFPGHKMAKIFCTWLSCNEQNFSINYKYNMSLLVIWGAMTLMWHHCNGASQELCLDSVFSVWVSTNFTQILKGYFTGTVAMIAPVPVKQPWTIWVSTSEEHRMFNQPQETYKLQWHIVSDQWSSYPNLAIFMMISSNGNIFQVTGLLWGESTSHQSIPLTKASDVEL